jgi:hypothetical protein
MTWKAIATQVILLCPRAIPSEEHNETLLAQDRPIANSQTTEPNETQSVKADSPCLSWFLLQRLRPTQNTIEGPALMETKHYISCQARSGLGPVAGLVCKEHGIANGIGVSGDEAL